MDAKILIIDDDAELTALTAEYLQGYGFGVASHGSGQGAVQAVERERPDLVVLDVMLPGMDGFEVLRLLRAGSGAGPGVAVVMLTAKGEDADRIVGLELGADDYLPKPFNPRELLARIRAVLRRRTPQEEPPAQAVIRRGELELNTASQSLTSQGGGVELSTTEFRLLRALMQRPNTALSRDELMTLAMGRDFEAFDRSVDVHVSRLRTKLEAASTGGGKRIKTVWGTGYMFVDAP